MSIPFDEAWLNDREPDNDDILENLYHSFLEKGYSPEVALHMALDEFDRIGI